MYRTHRLLTSTCLTATLLCALPLLAWANPIDGVVRAGQATVSTSGTTLDIHQQSQKVVIDWRGFDIAPGEHTAFHQPDSRAIALNRVTSTSASRIDGALSANGNVIIINQNGILFGRGATVDVNSLVASTADTDTRRFMEEAVLTLDKAGKPTAVIANEGRITAKEAGLVGLVAPNVINAGTITARLGRVHLASGDTAAVDMYGDGLMRIAVSDAVTSQLVSNTGTITADGGNIALTASAGSHIVNSLIAQSGALDARAVGVKNGTITIAAEGSNAVAGNRAGAKGVKQGLSHVLVTGTLDASGRKAGERGGTVAITGDTIALLNGTFIDASGHSGNAGTTVGKTLSARRVGAAGGDIRIGGDYLGQGDTATAKHLFVDAGVLVLNDALNSGDAGRSIFWSDGTTDFYGNVYARALGGKSFDALSWNAISGGHAGDGGFVETSGHEQLNVGGYVDATTSNGARGTYFLDPANIAIYGNVTPQFNSTDGSIDLDGAANNQLVLWLDASDAASINATGALVNQWPDKSGTGNHVTAAGAARPSTGTRTINGLNVIDFNGSSTVLIAPDAPSLDLGGAFSLFVLNTPDNVSTAPGLVAKRTAFGNNEAFTLFYDGGLLAVDINTSNDRFAFNATFTAGSTEYQGVIFDGSQAAANRVSVFNGGALDHVAFESSAAIADTNSNLNIGLLPNGGNFLDGAIGEVLLYNTPLNTTARQLVDQYQSAKWGKALTPPGSGATEAARATASTQKGDAADGYSAFTTRYLERLSQSANIALQAGNDITLDLKGDTLAFATAGRSLSLTAGNQITTASAGSITTTNGAVTFNATNGIVLNHALGLNSAGGNINVNNNLTLGAAQSWDAGAGTLSFGGTVNGAQNLTATAGTFSFASALGGTTPLAALSLTSANALTLPSITAASIFARTTGAAADLTIPAGKVVTASATGGTPLTLVAGRNFINDAGSGALALTGGGGARWLAYSTNPANDTVGGLSNAFRRFTCIFGGACPALGSGNGLLYSTTPTLTATPTATSVTYGNTLSLTGYAFTLSGYLGADAGDDVTAGSLDGTTTYLQGDNAGGTHAITYGSGVLTSTLGYGFSYANNAAGITVAARPLSIIPDSGQGKIFGAADPALTYSIGSGTLFGADSLGGALGRTAGETAGLYPILLGTLANSNYALTLGGGVTFAITGTAATPARTVPNTVTSVSANPTLNLAGDDADPAGATESFSNRQAMAATPEKQRPVMRTGSGGTEETSARATPASGILSIDRELAQRLQISPFF